MAKYFLDYTDVTYDVSGSRPLNGGVFHSTLTNFLTAIVSQLNSLYISTQENIQPFTPVVVTNGATVTLVAGTNYLAPAATIAGAVINIPTSPVDGEYFAVTTINQITAVTGTLNSTLGITELTANQVAKYRYNLATTTWYHV